MLKIGKTRKQQKSTPLSWISQGKTCMIKGAIQITKKRAADIIWSSTVLVNSAVNWCSIFFYIENRLKLGEVTASGLESPLLILIYS